MKKLDMYLAIFIGDERDVDRAMVRMWDMLRYDRCHPVSTPDQYKKDFIVVKQSYQKDMLTAFTVARWESFNFKVIPMTAPAGSCSIPYELFKEMENMVAVRTARREAVTT